MTTIKQRLESFLAEVECPPWRFSIEIKDTTFYLVGEYEEPDTFTGEPATQRTRKWQLSEHMTKSEVIQTALKCALTSAEHQVREAFKYRGQRVYGPHFDVDALWHIANEGHYAFRESKPVTP